MNRIPLPLEDGNTGAHLGSATMEVVVAVGDAVACAIAQVTYLDLEAEFWDATISPDWAAIEKAVARSAASRGMWHVAIEWHLLEVQGADPEVGVDAEVVWAIQEADVFVASGELVSDAIRGDGWELL
jgi:hypothetical protein